MTQYEDDNFQKKKKPKVTKGTIRDICDSLGDSLSSTTTISSPTLPIEQIGLNKSSIQTRSQKNSRDDALRKGSSRDSHNNSRDLSQDAFRDSSSSKNSMRENNNSKDSNKDIEDISKDSSNKDSNKEQEQEQVIKVLFKVLLFNFNLI